MQHFIEVTELTRKTAFNMTAPHSHDFYEFYFLFKGEREFFVKDKIYNVSENSLVIVPPFVIHKTEGTPYRRININISDKYFSKAEHSIITSIVDKGVVKLDHEHLPAIMHLLNESVEMNNNSLLPDRIECIETFVHAIIMLLGRSNLVSTGNESTLVIKNCSTDILKIVNYINKNFQKNITLTDIANKFFISKTTLCTNFNKTMHCSIIKYINNLRINKAKELLENTDRSIEEISNICGFSSPSYFGLAFKSKCGKSPVNYRKR